MTDTLDDLPEFARNAVNLASRLCDSAGNEQILISRKTYLAVENQVEVSEQEELELKGISNPVAVYNLIRRR